MAVILRRLGAVDYQSVWQQMRSFNEQRSAETADEIWLLQHPPVYTQGMNGRDEHLPLKSDIPVVETDRGGQVTYHGPGQLIVYLLLDLRRLKLGVRELVRIMEQAVIELLADYEVSAYGRIEAPGVYVEGAKIAALGLRIRRGCCYHGLALNVDVDLAPFNSIDPCGYKSLPVTRLKDFGINDSLDMVADKLMKKLLPLLGKNEI